MTWKLRPRARRDLDEIWTWSVAHWGEDRAERYVRAIVGMIEMVAADPGRGRNRNDIRPGYSSITSGSHVVFYRSGRRGIEIVRILHGRMDILRHL